MKKTRQGLLPFSDDSPKSSDIWHFKRDPSKMFHCIWFNDIHDWLVVDLPLWKIWVRQLGLWTSQYMEVHVPNHQPDEIHMFYFMFMHIHAYHAYPSNPIRNVHSPRRPRLNRAIRAVRRTRRIRVSRTAPETCPVCASGRGRYGRCKKGLTKPPNMGH